MIKAIDIAARATRVASPPANLPGISSFDDEALLKESIQIAGMIPQQSSFLERRRSRMVLPSPVPW